MSLSMLVGGADCGPSNPLTTLSKRIEKDPGVQKDRLGSAQTRETFRSQNLSQVGDHDLNLFFSLHDSQIPRPAPQVTYDTSALRAALPQHQTPGSQSRLSQTENWVSDFITQQGSVFLPINSLNSHSGGSGLVSGPSIHSHLDIGLSRTHNYPSQMRAVTLSDVTPLSQPYTKSSWDDAFRSYEISAQTSSHSVEPNRISSWTSHDKDELSHTAGLLLENIKDEQSPKFRDSQFLFLMQKLRDRKITVEGNQMVNNARDATSWNVKGKGRVVDGPISSIDRCPNSGETEKSVVTDNTELPDPNLAYFEKENEAYTLYWNSVEDLKAHRYNICV